MTVILIDTSTLIRFYKNELDEKTEGALRKGISGISIMTYFEIIRWLLKVHRANERPYFIQRMQETFDIIPLSLAICEHAAQIAHSDSFSTADALIYATALENGIKLMTSDTDLKGKPGVIFAPRRNRTPVSDAQ
ncbi:PIN domain-containing protein [Candidatus Micrarchaeota archaeon]|nr:PIN domain-containing protein [Candidatus Micrarchaeota archaeon]